MISLLEDAKKNPLSNAVIIFLLFLIMASFPTSTFIAWMFNGYENVYLSVYSIRILFIGIFLFLFYKYGLFGYFKINSNKSGWLVFIAVMLIALNNFPFISVLSNSAEVVKGGFRFQYVLAMLTVAFAEELVFRGFILVFMAKYVSEKTIKRRTFLVILINSAVFAITHLINIFSGVSIGGTLLQVGYAFLIGVTLSLLAIKSKSVILPFIAHFVYNVGGNLVGYGLLYGRQWSVGQIIITVIVAVAVAVYIVWELFKLKDEEIVNFLPENYKN